MDDQMEAIFKKLEQARDELRVQLDLGKKEVKSAWEDFDDDFKQLKTKVRQLKSDSEKASGELRKETSELVEDVGESIRDLRDRFA